MRRRTKHRRRFHTSRIIWKREARIHIYGSEFFGPHWPRPPLGKLRNRDFYLMGCSCDMCKWDKRDPSRRHREKASWDWEVQEGLAERERSN